MKTITVDYVKNNLNYLIDELTNIHEPIRIEGEKKRAIVMLEVEYFERLQLSQEVKDLRLGGKKSVQSIFGMLKHKAQPKSVSIEEMEEVIKKRRYRRATK
ncbi:MAG: type II toxin-antitoxin system Phd/YefM family antitoxin [Desulfamplus sp.]|nr:type II toxin-antitoxin system Phd/YefM family antitoxin [Desulfamplus sp.]